MVEFWKDDANIRPTESPVRTSLFLFPSKTRISVGVAMSLIGNMLISIAMNIQKHAHNQIAGTGKPYVTSITWWFGLILIGFGELGNFAAYGFAPASLVAPLGSSGVIVNAIIAVLFLKEKLRLRDVIGITWAIIGGYMLVTFSNQKEITLNGDEILHYLRQYPFLIYIIIEVNMLLFIYFLHHYKKQITVVTILMQVALLGSFTVISAKAISSMLCITFRGINQLAYPIFYLMFIVLIISATGQIIFLNQAMASFDASVVMPINFILFTISAILSGITFYQEFYALTFIQVFMTLFGAGLSFGGVCLICGGRENNNTEDEGSELLDDECLSTDFDISKGRELEQ